MKSISKITFLIICCVLVSAFVSQQKITIYMVGDSTMANKEAVKYPETGWGQVFNQYFNNDVTIVNKAMNGRSSKSFIAENRWQWVLDKLQKDDYVFIEFGHNDEKVNNPKLGTTLDEYKINLARYVTEARAKNAIPVLLTPVERRIFKNGSLYDSHGGYPEAVRQVAAENKVPMIDMQKKSNALLTTYGTKQSLALFLQVDSGVSQYYPKGIHDNTHFSEEGAKAMAVLAVEGIKELKLPLASYLKN